jgi:hypothetical protein
MIYFAPDNTITLEHQSHFGVFISLGGQRELMNRVWAMDNGRFGSQGINQKWTEDAWLKMLERYTDSIATCKFCVVPDIPYDAAGTLDLFQRYAPVVRAHGYPVAICTQDGMSVEDIPWEGIDAIFVGGSDDHKLGAEAITLLMEGMRLGKWTHVGRVNSAERIRQFWYVDSVDGTTIARENSIPNVSNLKRAISFARGKKASVGRLI